MTEITKPTTSGLLKAAVVVPSDTPDLPITARALWIGSAGNLAVIMAGNDVHTSVTLTNVPVGLLSGLYICRVLATGTTTSAIRPDLSRWPNIPCHRKVPLAASRDRAGARCRSIQG